MRLVNWWHAVSTCTLCALAGVGVSIGTDGNPLVKGNRIHDKHTAGAGTASSQGEHLIPGIVVQKASGWFSNYSVCVSQFWFACVNPGVYVNGPNAKGKVVDNEISGNTDGTPTPSHRRAACDLSPVLHTMHSRRLDVAAGTARRCGRTRRRSACGGVEQDLWTGARL
eukprot:1488029-Pleurochrysis_carterae.AAC.5